MEERVARLEADMAEVKGTLGKMMPMLTRIETMLSSSLPHLATKAELATLRTELIETRAQAASDNRALRTEVKVEIAAFRAELFKMPSKPYLWAVLGVLLTAVAAAYAAGLAAVASLR